MKVAVVGGTGVFGRRLVTLLRRDGHKVAVAGRRVTKDQSPDRIKLDRNGDLAPLWAWAPDVVVDAAGPFQGYGEDPYSFAKQVVARGIGYLDLADDAAFCVGISKLDSLAREKGTFAISGLSSVPALSSAVVSELARGLNEITMIDIAILPGNRAPRGRAVIASILSGIGQPFSLWRAGRWEDVRGWSDPANYTLPGGLQRQGWLIKVPDTVLFPHHFSANTVLFRAGLELGVMRLGLWGISRLRGHWPFAIRDWMVSTLRFIAWVLWPFGSDVGGMSVTVVGRTGDGAVRRVWRLRAEAGEGPFIPTVPARAMLVSESLPDCGAGPALAVLPLDRMEQAMADINVYTERHEEEITPLFPTCLGAGFDDLPMRVRESHDVVAPLRLEGKAQVERGCGWWARLLAWVFGFPAAGVDIPLSVIKNRIASKEHWQRQFGPSRFRSVLQLGPDGMTERFGPFTFTLGLEVRDHALHYPVLSGRCLGLPMPRFLLPTSETREFEEDGKFRFDVRLFAPITQELMVHYKGWLTVAPASGPDRPIEC